MQRTWNLGFKQSLKGNMTSGIDITNWLDLAHKNIERNASNFPI